MSTGDGIDYAEAMAALLTFIDDELGSILSVVGAVRSAARLEDIQPRTEAEMTELDAKVRAEAGNGDWPKPETMRKLTGQGTRRDKAGS